MKKVFLFLSVLLIIYSNGYSQNDFFPLSTGNYFKYSFQSVSQKFYSAQLEEEVLDSGIVIYEVVSLTVKDTVFEWNIRETDSLFRQIHYGVSPLNDTNYYISTVSNSILRQRRDSLNKIEFRPKQEIWQTPTLWEKGVSFFRYRFDDSLFIIRQSVPQPPFYYSDSLVFRKNLGLIGGKGNSSQSSNSHNSFSWEAELIDYSIATKVEQDENLLMDFELLQNYPNPFNPSTTIEFSIPEKGNVVLKIFDILGNEITTLINEDKTAGSHSVVFGANNLPTGIYFYKIRAGNYTATRKLILLK